MEIANAAHPIVVLWPGLYSILRHCGHVEKAAANRLDPAVAVTLDCLECTYGPRIVEVHGRHGVARLHFPTTHAAQDAYDALTTAGIRATLSRP